MEKDILFKAENIALAVIEKIEEEYKLLDRKENEQRLKEAEFTEEYQLLSQLLVDNPSVAEYLEYALERCREVKLWVNHPRFLTWAQRQHIKGQIELMAYQNGFANYTIEELASLLKP